MCVRSELIGARNTLSPGRRMLVGGVGYRWMGDSSFGLAVSDALAALPRPQELDVADLGYGALYVAQDLAAASPPYGQLILVAGVARGRAPGRLYHSRWKKHSYSAADLQERIREAGAGVIDLDHLLLIADHFQALPPDVELIELEPVDISCGERLSPQAAALVEDALELIRHWANLQRVDPSHAAAERKRGAT